MAFSMNCSRNLTVLWTNCSFLALSRGLMSNRYIDIDPKKLESLHDALELLETLDRDAMGELDLCVYGLTTNATILDSAKEAIADNADFDAQEEDVTLAEIAVAVPISSDLIYSLAGNGMRLRNEYFAY